MRAGIAAMAKGIVQGQVRTTTFQASAGQISA